MMFEVMFIFTSSAELQMSLSLLLSGCECCFSDYVKCLWINLQEIILNVVLFKRINKYLKHLMKNHFHCQFNIFH